VSRIHIGAKVPNNETVASPEHLKQFAKGLEQLGFDHLSIDDHVSTAPVEAFGNNPGGFTTVRSQHELFTSLAWLAGATTNLRFRTGVLILPQRQTVLVARQAAEVDLLSNGRLTLGVGLGWNPLEFNALGESFAQRSLRIGPQIELLRRLWVEEYVTSTDQWHNLDRTGILPGPVQQSIPIWVGASAVPAIRRAARVADGFMALGRIGERAEHQVAIYLDEREQRGLGSTPFGLEGWIDLNARGASSWKAQARKWHELGATHITLVSPARPLISIDDHLELLRQGIESVTAG
jgi:probable F420-dependent oxidoreductase